jgi:hypothetical protein
MQPGPVGQRTGDDAGVRSRANHPDAAGQPDGGAHTTVPPKAVVDGNYAAVGLYHTPFTSGSDNQCEWAFAPYGELPGAILHRLFRVLLPLSWAGAD